MRNQQHYDIAQSRKYPFDDSATMIDDNGQRLPEGLLCDLSLLIDSSIANRVFVSGVTKSGDFCSIVLSADNAERTAVGLIVGSIDNQDVEFNYGNSPAKQVKPLVRGFQGTAVFGDQWSLVEDNSWRFSTPASALVLARCCWPVKLPGAQTAAASYSQRLLQGLVQLQAEGDIDLDIDNRTLGDVNKRALVVSLSRTSSDVLRQYANDQQRRPESRSCGDPAPIETINGVAADCCGRVFIELRGCAQPIRIDNTCGVVLDCPLTLADICPAEIDYGETDNPDQCLFGGEDNVLQPAENQPNYPTQPPAY